MKADRLKHVADIRVSNVDKKSEDGVPVVLCNYTDVYYHERVTDDLDFMVATATRDQVIAFRLFRGDVVITKDSETADDIGVGTIVDVNRSDLVCGYHLAVIRAKPNRAYGPYLRWVLASRHGRDQMAAAATGVTRFGLRAESIADLLVPIHSLNIQSAIADYLDRETARIDALVVAKRRMAELLEERFAESMEAMIHLDIRSPLTTVGRLLTKKITDGPHETPEFLDSGVPFLSIEAIVEDRMAMDRCRFVSADDHLVFCRKCKPQRGDVLLAKTGATIGKVALVDTDAEFSIWSPLALLRPRAGMLRSEYLWFVLQTRSTQRLIRELATQSTQPNIAMGDIARLPIRLRTLCQQDQIVQELRRENRLLMAAKGVFRAQTALLQERRQALISAAVTGQLDIPEAA